MKARIYPKTELVKSVLQERINEARNVIETNTSDLERLNSGGLILPGQEQYLEQANAMAKSSVQRLELQVAMLESHGPAEVAVEIEL